MTWGISCSRAINKMPEIFTSEAGVGAVQRTPSSTFIERSTGEPACGCIRRFFDKEITGGRARAYAGPPLLLVAKSTKQTA